MTEKRGEYSELPTSDVDDDFVTTEPPPSESTGVHVSVYICVWILLSSIVIAFNKWILGYAKYPILLTTWHLVTSSLLTQIMAFGGFLKFPTSGHKMTPRKYLSTIVPIGVFYSLSLAFGNITYLYLSVSFIQMLKAVTPVVVLLARIVLGLARPNLEVSLIVMTIVFGVATTASGEMHFNLIGFIYQSGAIVFEAIRVVLVERVLGAEGKMSPMVALYYYAPACAVINGALFLMIELPSVDTADIIGLGFGVLCLNAAAAFLLNVASVALIGKSSSLVLSLSGVLKNILVVVVSMFLYNEIVTWIQVAGYSVATAGLIAYNLGSKQILSAMQDFFSMKDNKKCLVWLGIGASVCIGAITVFFFLQFFSTAHFLVAQES